MERVWRGCGEGVERWTSRCIGHTLKLRRALYKISEAKQGWCLLKCF